MKNEHENETQKDQHNGCVKDDKVTTEVLLNKEDLIKQRIEELRKRDPFIYR